MRNIEALRRDTPATQSLVHLNSAGASLPPDPVVRAQRQYLDHEARWGGYRTARELAPQIERFYTEIGRMLNAPPDAIAFAHSATDAWVKAFLSVPLGPGDRVLTTSAAYASNFLTLLHDRKRRGFEIVTVPHDDDGVLDLSLVENELRKGVKLLVLTHLPTNGGLVNPAGAVGALAQRYETLYLLDACQSAGQYPLDVEALGCDMLTATGRKFLRGPRGTGFLYVRPEMLERLTPPWIDLTGAEWTEPEGYELRAGAKRFESFERHYAGQVGLAEAVAYANNIGLDRIWTRVQKLAASLRAQLRTIWRVEVHDVGAVQSGIVTFSVGGKPADSVQQFLRKNDINVSVSRPASSLLDARQRQLPETVRASVHYFNTEAELAMLCERLRSYIAAPLA